MGSKGKQASMRVPEITHQHCSLRGMPRTFSLEEKFAPFHSGSLLTFVLKLCHMLFFVCGHDSPQPTISRMWALFSQCGEPFPHSLIFLVRTEPLHGWSGLGMLPCSLSGRAGVRLQGSPIPSLGLFSRRQTGSSCTPRALWLELVWIPGLQTLATAQSALDLSSPSKKKTYLMISLFWIPDHLIHSPKPCNHLWLFLSGCPFSLLLSSTIFSFCWVLRTIFSCLTNLLNSKIWLILLSQLVSLHVAWKVSYFIILLLRGL